jgi:hypothetical protein
VEIDDKPACALHDLLEQHPTDAYQTVFALISAGARGLRRLQRATAISNHSMTTTTTSLACRWLYTPSLTSHNSHGNAMLRQATKPNITKAVNEVGKMRNAELS